MNKNLLLKYNLAAVGADSNNINCFIDDKKYLYSEGRYYGINAQTPPIIKGAKLGWLTVYNFAGDSSYSEHSADNSIGVMFELMMEGASKRIAPSSEKLNCIDYKSPHEVQTSNKSVIIHLSDLTRLNKNLYLTVRPWNLLNRDKVEEPLLSSLLYMIYANPTIDIPERIFQNLSLEITKLMIDKWFKEILIRYPENFVWDIKNSIDCALRSL